MKIGIDFDNTIAKYDKLFLDIALSKGLIDETSDCYDKITLRDYLRQQPDGERSWMRLQGLVYGQYMYAAQLMPGFARFMMKCKERRHHVFVVSHKTEFGHFDSNNISLRKEAMKWMTNKGFFTSDVFGLKKTDVFFADNRDDKVTKIAELQCDYFIDDLPEVFSNHKFPANTRKILFSNNHRLITDYRVDDWDGIDDHICGGTSSADISMWFTMLTVLGVDRVDEVPRGGNSNIYKIHASDGNIYAAKVYPYRSVNIESRLTIEYRATEFLRSNGLDNIPDTITSDEDLGLGIYSWVNGESIEKVNLQDVEQIISFVKKLQHISQSSQYEYDGTAAEACLSAKDLVKQVDKRLDNLLRVAIDYSALKIFLTELFVPIWHKLKEQSIESWPHSSRYVELKRDYQILSPSDFGFHNTLRYRGKLHFLDFEYFGWDDPVKLTADFLWHPAMSLRDSDMKHWEESMLKIFSSDVDFETRLNIAKPLFGMRWAMIVLNKFLLGSTNSGNTDLNINVCCDTDVLDDQLNKAKTLCDKVIKCCPQVAVV
jgi:hypothetical protein